MTYTVKFESRDFSSPIISVTDFHPTYFSWSALGGPKNLHLVSDGPQSYFMQFLNYLRCPVTVYVNNTTPVWWGFISEVTVFVEDVQIHVTLDNLYNSVRVRYSFISPDQHLGDVTLTAASDHAFSQTEFGVRECILHEVNIDDDYALNLRDTFLSTHALPLAELSQSSKNYKSRCLIKCKGWFDTLSWKNYSNSDGFFANYGPGPGIFDFSQSAAYTMPSQRFTPSAGASLKYAYFQLRKVGSPTRNIYARLYTNAGALLATSAAFNSSTLDTGNWIWAKFTFSTPYSLAAGTDYMIGVYAGTPSATHYFQIKTDENMNYYDGWGRYYDGATWNTIPSITKPGTAPDLYFRAICLQDTGTQLTAMVTDINQFFTSIDVPVTNVEICPFRRVFRSCDQYILYLCSVGTSNFRPLFSNVDVNRKITFYEQPDPTVPTVFLGSDSRFYQADGIQIPPHFPPIGQFASYLGSSHILLPFSNPNLPPAFINMVEYWPESDKVRVHS